MPIYEFRWQTHTRASSQGGDSSCCPVVKWDGNNGECQDRSWAVFLAAGWPDTPFMDWKEDGTGERRVGRKMEISDRWGRYYSHCRAHVYLRFHFILSFILFFYATALLCARIIAFQIRVAKVKGTKHSVKRFLFSNLNNLFKHHFDAPHSDKRRVWWRGYYCQKVAMVSSDQLFMQGLLDCKFWSVAQGWSVCLGNTE